MRGLECGSTMVLKVSAQSSRCRSSVDPQSDKRIGCGGRCGHNLQDLCHIPRVATHVASVPGGVYGRCGRSDGGERGSERCSRHHSDEPISIGGGVLSLTPTLRGLSGAFGVKGFDGSCNGSREGCSRGDGEMPAYGPPRPTNHCCARSNHLSASAKVGPEVGPLNEGPTT